MSIVDCKETAKCGMVIHYTVNDDDIVVYNDINGRGVLCPECSICSWKCICKPECSAVDTLKKDICTKFDDFDKAVDRNREKLCQSIHREIIDAFLENRIDCKQMDFLTKILFNEYKGAKHGN